jgi:hypothetical protein
VPVGAPPVPVTVAVKVTGWPALLGFCEEVRVVCVVVAAYVKRSAAETGDVPFAVVTVTSTVPVPADDVAVIEVAELTVKAVALVAPNFTAVAPVKVVPVMVTDVPPATGPVVGEIDVTVGGAM